MVSGQDFPLNQSIDDSLGIYGHWGDGRICQKSSYFPRFLLKSEVNDAALGWISNTASSLLDFLGDDVGWVVSLIHLAVWYAIPRLLVLVPRIPQGQWPWYVKVLPKHCKCTGPCMIAWGWIETNAIISGHIPSGYVKIAIEYCHRNSGFTH